MPMQAKCVTAAALAKVPTLEALQKKGARHKATHNARPAVPMVIDEAKDASDASLSRPKGSKVHFLP